jgi:hypothetical protein
MKDACEASTQALAVYVNISIISFLLIVIIYILLFDIISFLILHMISNFNY